METLPPFLSAVLVGILYIFPLLHVIFSDNAGPWRVTASSRCPFSPKLGWIVIILFLGLFGWIIFFYKTSIERHN